MSELEWYSSRFVRLNFFPEKTHGQKKNRKTNLPAQALIHCRRVKAETAGNRAENTAKEAAISGLREIGTADYLG